LLGYFLLLCRTVRASQAGQGLICFHPTDLHFAYLEINPLICLDATPSSPPQIHYLDMAAKLDQTADFICGPKWAIARDTSTAEASTGSKILADRGPAMVWREFTPSTRVSVTLT
jgi:hypothetical protein